MKITKQRLQQIIKEEVNRFTATEVDKKSQYSVLIKEACEKIKEKVTLENLLEELLDVMPEEEVYESLKFIAEANEVNLEEEKE